MSDVIQGGRSFILVILVGMYLFMPSSIALVNLLSTVNPLYLAFPYI